MGISRVVGALPFLLLFAWSWREMNLDQIISTARPSAESGFIEWGNDNKFAILDDFHGVDFLTGSGAAAPPPSPIAAWQTFHFLIDLGPLYAIWILESHRAANAWSPAYIPTVFAFVSQLTGAAITMPVFYFLCIVFSPSASELARSRPPRRSAWARGNILLIPLVLVLHTAEVFAMFLAPSYESRHYWTWAWQSTPLLIGIGNVLAGLALRLFPGRRIRSPSPSSIQKAMLAVLVLISTAVWVYTITFSPHPLATLFTPGPEPQDGLVLRSRKAFQADEIGLFSSSFLWLVYSYFDLYLAGLLSLKGLLYNVASFPIGTLVLGPGSTFAVSWYARELLLGSA
ncbi:hypothetical protein PG997_015365 [Apiospora hydei]|uniref:Uncharacterized protein n=1 Tax=Apiospora hydei TaxID=1337664 RepID=A0ABR1UTK3_9PEZI